MARLLNRLANAFPLWVLVCSSLALVRPEWFAWFRGPMIVWGLAVIMLGMGITLTLDDFRRVLRTPWPVAAGFAAQYSIMPLLGFGIGRLLGLEAPFAVGLILVACCPGGTASNVVTYIARANVALSVLMTMCSTLGAVFMTPLLTSWLAGTYVPVDARGLLLSTVQVVLLPLAIGLALHHGFPSLVRAVLPVAPLVSVITIALICASIVGQNRAAVLHSGGKMLLGVFLLHVGGFALGYLAGRALRLAPLDRRTLSIEVGMQNSGLGTVLAQRHFADPLTAVPCAISATFHSIIGSVLAGAWRMRAPTQSQSTREADIPVCRRES